MISEGQTKGTVRFALRPSNSKVKSVLLAGDFNGWKPVAMRKQKDGLFAVTLPLKKGTYEYKFLVDGCWEIDRDNACWSPNAYGTMNSVAQVAS